MADTPEDVGLDSKAQTERDRIDLNHEQAGGDTGRIKRFLVEGASGYNVQSEEKKSERRLQTLLEILLAEDPHYAALYRQVTEKINGISRTVDQALIDVNQRLEASVEMLQKYRDSAAELPDGTKVFRSDIDGSIYTEDGQRLSDEEAQSIDIPEGAASWEDYRRQREERELALRQREEIERYKQEVLDPIKERLRDPDNVFSREELENIDKNIEASLPDILKNEHKGSDPSVSATGSSTSTSAAHNMVEETNLEVPDMSKAFDLARVDIPAPAPEPVPGPQATQTYGHS
ncbi:MAG: hypothetical protein JAZ18_01830 [Candidatus Thiodiazotropha endolucinida]|nr:hypothetical protein [Candidatus Thiodiazotropha endolucinida]